MLTTYEIANYIIIDSLMQPYFKPRKSVYGFPKKTTTGYMIDISITMVSRGDY